MLYASLSLHMLLTDVLTKGENAIFALPVEGQIVESSNFEDSKNLKSENRFFAKVVRML